MQERKGLETVLDKVTIAYRGATYEVGRGREYFGIWTVDGSRSQPLEWWPETQEGWSAACPRFAVLEAPDTITQVGQTVTRPAERAETGFAPAVAAGRRGALAAALLLGVGVALGIAGLFPDYLSGTSVAAQADNLVAHVIYLAAWAVSGVLIVLGGTRLRVGALLATGLSIVTFGLFLADAGTPIAGRAHLAGGGPRNQPGPRRQPNLRGGSGPRGAPGRRARAPVHPGVAAGCSAGSGRAAGPGRTRYRRRLRSLLGQLHAPDGGRTVTELHLGQRLRQSGTGDRRQRGRDGRAGRSRHRGRPVAPRPVRRGPARRRS